VNGKLVEEALIAQFSAISAGDLEKLTDMYSTLNFCSNLTSWTLKNTQIACFLIKTYSGGMDPCDKVAKLLKCGKDNSPDAVAGLMQNLENAITVARF